MGQEAAGSSESEVEEFLVRERDLLAARLASVERAYEELLARVRGYERERVEIRGRLERILHRLEGVDPAARALAPRSAP